MLSLSLLRREPTSTLMAVVVAALLFVLPSSLLAQPTAPDASAAEEPEPSWPFEPKAEEWKEIEPGVLEIDHHPADSNATAVILSDVGNTFLDRRGDLRHERHRRIKLLSEAAYDEYGTVEIYFTSEDRARRIRDIDGHTFTLDDNGEVQRVELDKDDVFEEEVSDTRSKITFTLPNLEPGAVIEYKYEIVSEDPLLLPDWTFQAGEPTVYSEYEVNIPDVLRYIRMQRGDHTFDVETSKQIRDRNEYRWVATNIPALREEPYMTTVDDYRLAIRFQLQSFQNPRTMQTTRFMESWPALAEDLMDSHEFGRQLRRHDAVKDQTEAIVADLQILSERAKAIYKFVSENMDWDDRDRLLPSDDLDDVLERRRGSSADINMLLCSMLQIAGLEAYPVLISTRSHGATVPMYPFVSQFNSVIAVVKVGENFVLLDGTDPNRPFGKLPSRALNREGWMVGEEKQNWINIPPTGSDSRETLVNATIGSDGTVTSKISVIDKSYRALQSRTALQEASDARDYVSENLLSVESIVESAETSGETRDDEEMRVTTEVTLPAYAQVAGDFIYINPMILNRYEEAVFKKENRAFPIDFPYPIVEQYTFSLEIPEGYEVKETPEQRVVQGGEDVVFQRLVQTTERMLSMRITMVLNRTRIMPTEYSVIRSFFDEIVAAHSEPIVLQKVQAPDEDPASSRASAPSTGDVR